MTLRPAAAVLASLAAACCSPPPAPEATPAPPVAAVPTPTPSPARTAASAPPATTWMDAAQTPGDWRYSVSGQRTSATFGAPGGEPRFAATCDRSRRTVMLSRAGAASGPVPMRLRTETRDGMLTAAPTGETPPSVSVTLPARDPILDAMAFSKGRFAVETAGMPTLYIPSWPELTRVIEDCR